MACYRINWHLIAGLYIIHFTKSLVHDAFSFWFNIFLCIWNWALLFTCQCVDYLIKFRRCWTVSQGLKNRSQFISRRASLYGIISIVWPAWYPLNVLEAFPTNVWTQIRLPLYLQLSIMLANICSRGLKQTAKCIFKGALRLMKVKYFEVSHMRFGTLGLRKSGVLLTKRL